MDDEFKKLYREMKILRAKKDAGGPLHPKDERRLAWLEERMGDAAEVKRIQVDEPVDTGPKVLTSDDHWATEMSQDLLDQADAYEPQKAWEKDARARPQRSFEVRDTREGKATFKQEGMSSFAIEATEDMREGEIGLSDAPAEEEEAARKLDYHRPVYAQDESERLTKKSEGSNPFALDIADSLVRGLDKHKDYSGTVPDNAAKSWEVDVGDEDEEAWDRKDTRAVPAEEISEELKGMLRKSYELPREDSEDVSLGARTSHDTGDQPDEQGLDLDLMRSALDYAEQRGLVEEDRQVWATDDEGRDVQYEEETVSLRASLDAGGELPMPARSPEPLRSLSEPEEPTGATMELTPDIPAGQPTNPRVGAVQTTHEDEDDLGVLIPPPPPPPPGEPPTSADDEQPASYDAETTRFEADEDGGVLIPDPPAPDADDPPTEIEKPRPRFNDGATTRPGVVQDAAGAEQEATTDENAVLIPPPPRPAASGEYDVIVHETEETHLMDAPEDVPDLSGEDEILEIPVHPEPDQPHAIEEPPEVAIEVEPENELVLDDDTQEGDLADLADAGAEVITGHRATPASNGELDLASDSDVEMVSDSDVIEVDDPGGARNTVFSPDELGAEEIGEDGSGSELDVDAFWGLSGDDASDQEATASQQVEEEPGAATPQPPAAPAGGSKPLPALSFTPGTGPAAPPAPSARQAPPANNDVQDHAFLDSLFSQAEQEVEEDGMEPVPAQPASPASPRRKPPAVPLSKNDLPRTGFGPAPRPAATGKPQPQGHNDLRGPRKATVHYKDGVTCRGVIGQVDTDADLIRLDPQPGSSAPAEDLVALSLKTIFLMLPRGTPPPEKAGMGVQLVLIDGRRLEGFVPDYDPQRKAFTLFPAEARGNIERVIVFNDAVKNIWFDE